MRYPEIDSGEVVYAGNPEEIKNKPIIINIILFIATFFTTTFASYITSILSGGNPGISLSEAFYKGLPYSITLISILLAHELGHYFAARRFGVKATLPYFIPFPSLIGTLGAVIKVKSRIPDKRALFYIGAMGPVMGFILSLLITVYGISVSKIQTIPSGGENISVIIFGDSILFSLIVKFFHGAIPPGKDIFLSQYAWAGWIGFLVTSLNLMPVGQLDGSHILYALIGRKQLFFGWAAVSGLIILSFYWIGWIIWVIIIMLGLMVSHPPVNDGDELSFKEKVAGWTCMAIFIITFIPVPVEIL